MKFNILIKTMRRLFLSVLAIPVAFVAIGWFPHGVILAPVDPIIVFAGQSNMLIANTLCNELTGTYAYLQPANANVKLSDLSGNFASYQACNASSPNYLGSQWWGPEAQFTYQWTQDNPGKTLYIIKYSVGSAALYNTGNSANNFSPEATSANFVATQNLIATVIGNLQALGKNPKVVGIIWMQGETDSENPTYAASYQVNLADFIVKARASWAPSNTPIVIGRINDYSGHTYGTTVQAAQDANASTSTPVVNTSNQTTYPLQAGSDDYTYVGGVNLGAAFYTAYLGAH